MPGRRSISGLCIAIASVLRGPFAHISHPQKRAFLAAFVQVARIGRAASIAGVDRHLHLYWMRDAAFREAWALARHLACEALEDEAARRAIEGVERLTGWYQGSPGGVARDYSDNLLMFVLKGLLPDKYRERVEVRGTIASIAYDKLPDTVIARIAAGEHPLSVLASEGIQAAPLSASDKVEVRALPKPKPEPEPLPKPKPEPEP